MKKFTSLLLAVLTVLSLSVPAMAAEKSGFQKVNTYTVRIPQKETEEGFRVLSGDIVVHGECQDMITKKSPDTASEVLQRNKPDAFLVTAFSDNTSHRMGKHYRLRG